MRVIKNTFSVIYNDTYDKVLNYILAKCGKTPDVQDILQETYTELYKTLLQNETGYIRYPEAFMLRLAKSKVYQFYSEKEHQAACIYVDNTESEVDEAATDNVTWEDNLMDKLTADEVMEYIAGKDELTREIFYQHFFQDKTLKEIADAYGVKESTVKNRLYRTLKELKGMKRFAIIAAILLLAALLAKPVYTWAEDVISNIKRLLVEDTEDTLKCIELGRAYKMYLDGKISIDSSISVNGEEYSFEELETIWMANPWLEELDWSDIK